MRPVLTVTPTATGEEVSITEEGEAFAKSIINGEIGSLTLKQIKGKQDNQSRNRFLRNFSEYKTNNKTSDYLNFLIHVILSKNSPKLQVPMAYFKAIIEKLGYNKHFSYRAFTHFHEIRTLGIALNYDQWKPVLDTIKVYYRKCNPEYQFESPYATSAVVATVNGVTIKMEFCQIKKNKSSSSQLHEIKPGDPNPYEQQQQQEQQEEQPQIEEEQPQIEEEQPQIEEEQPEQQEEQPQQQQEQPEQQEEEPQQQQEPLVDYTYDGFEFGDPWDAFNEHSIPFYDLFSNSDN